MNNQQEGHEMSDNGFNTAPERYTAKGRETIDRGMSESGRELSAWRRAFREWARAGDIRTADRRQITPKGLQALRRHA